MTSAPRAKLAIPLRGRTFAVPGGRKTNNVQTTTRGRRHEKEDSSSHGGRTRRSRRGSVDCSDGFGTGGREADAFRVPGASGVGGASVRRRQADDDERAMEQ